MYITIDSPTKRLRSEHTNGEVVEFSDSGTAQVTADIGEQMIANYENVTEKDN